MLLKENRFHLVGIASHSFKCSERAYPAVYSRIAYYANWIRTQLSWILFKTIQSVYFDAKEDIYAILREREWHFFSYVQQARPKVKFFPLELLFWKFSWSASFQSLSLVQYILVIRTQALLPEK